MIFGILDSVIFQELISLGFRVSTGEFEQLEVDFVAEKDYERLCIQMHHLLVSLETKKPRVLVLRKNRRQLPQMRSFQRQAWGLRLKWNHP